MPQCLFEHRMHVVRRIEILAVDPSASKAEVETTNASSTSSADERDVDDKSLPLMQFDEEIPSLIAAKLCKEASERLENYNTSDCSTFKLDAESSLKYCGAIGLTSASKRGQGSYYYPNPPVWNNAQGIWDTKGSQRFYLTGPTRWWRVLQQAPPKVIFKGYPEFKETDTFWKLPCDQGIDEILFGVLIVMIIRIIVTVISIFDEISKLNYVKNNESEPIRFGSYLTIMKWVPRLEIITTIVFGFLLWFLYEYTVNSVDCKYNSPEIYWTSVFFMVYASIVAIFLGLKTLRDMLFIDADPGVCTKTCQQKFSANVMILPCGHIPGVNEPQNTPIQDSMRMCFACSHLHSECPVCKRLVENRRKIHRGHLSPFVLSLCALVQMLIPVMNIKWVFMHSACFVRDIPPHEYAPGCIMILVCVFALMMIGFLGMKVASTDGSSTYFAKMYTLLSLVSFVFSLSSGIMFLGYAQPDFNAVSSTDEMLTVRRWGYSQSCVKEKMLNHAFKELFGNSCSVNGQQLSAIGKAPWYYELFSCMPCDKTSPNSCLGSAKAQSQGMYTSFAAFGFLLRAISDIYGYVCASAVIIYNRRQKREQNARKRSKKAMVKRKLTKLARRVLTQGYRYTCKEYEGLIVELSPPEIWGVGSDKRELLYEKLMLEVEHLARKDVDSTGSNSWDPSFFPPGVFQDRDSQKYKLLTDTDRRRYFDEVVNRVIFSGVESNKVE